MHPSGDVGCFPNRATFGVTVAGLSVGPARLTTIDAVCQLERRPARTYGAMYWSEKL